MPAKLCTAEYFQQVADALNADEDFRDDAENFSFYFLFQVTDDPTVMFSAAAMLKRRAV